MEEVGAQGAPHGTGGAVDFDGLTLEERLRLFAFTQRENHLAYYWVLRALDRLRATHRPQAAPSEVAEALAELAREHDGVPDPGANLRRLLDDLRDEDVLHRAEDASRAGSLANYRNRNSIYQFTEIGYRTYQAVQAVLSARVSDANLSRLVVTELLRDLRALAQANGAGDTDEVYRRLMRLDATLTDMTQRAARFYLMLADLGRTTDASPERFLRYKQALLSHMGDFSGELSRFAPLLAEAVREVEHTGTGTLVRRAAEADERVLMLPQDRLADWQRRWDGLHEWFVGTGGDDSGAQRMLAATRAAISGVIALLRQVTESRETGVSRTTQLRHLAEWVTDSPDDDAVHALAAAAFNLGSVRHVGAAHDDADQISSRATWWDAPGVEVHLPVFRTGKGGGPGQPKAVRTDNKAQRASMRDGQRQRRTAERAAATALAVRGAHGRALDERETAALLRLLTKALPTRPVPVTGRVPGRSEADSVALTLVPDAAGSVVHTAHGSLRLPGLRLELDRPGAARPAAAEGAE
ncbi:uncharacterized protein (TIGR02677 family) [Murinocardiopsis flavida]|uniref:Uncharacterized protein (TIGR02677 family) n=1 Tax=Murinocardiopsis flavida TaxID=645275 RepID=A0A2P8DGB2_9ACTN|nr:TIGR02677 family protein [Murinocardiopsis flavida]PSK96255.1 uncharacterized protein (TIGR02677 family) [Murinocardiopsis flavida]